MIDVAGAENAGLGTDLNLTRGLPDSQWHRRQWTVAAASAILHLLFFGAAVRLPSVAVPPNIERRDLRRQSTKLYLPSKLLTQRAPNKAEPTKNIDLASLLAKPQAAGQRSSPAPSRRHFEAPAPSPRITPQATPRIQPDLPPDTTKTRSPQEAAALPPGAPLPFPAAPSKAPAPDSPFQNVGSEPAPANPSMKPPGSGVDSAIQQLAQKSTGRQLTITDDNDGAATPGIAGGIGAAGASHAAVELQSDPQGADFKAYLIRILSLVRSNWRRVIPESARMGTVRGRTVVEFIINRDGSIPKVVIATPSGLDPLDRAAGAGLSMSNPLPPLPADFHGFQVRLAFTFSYNMPTQ